MSCTEHRPDHLAGSSQDAGDSPVTAPAWKNLIFLTTGPSLLGGHVFPTEEAAREAAVTGAAAMALGAALSPNAQVVRQGTREVLYLCREFSHCVQIPWVAP